MSPQAKQIEEIIYRLYGDPFKYYAEEVVVDLIAARCFYIMRAQDDSIPYNRVKEVTNRTYDEVMKHFFPNAE